MNSLSYYEEQNKIRVSRVEEWLENWFKSLELPAGAPILYLLESMKYSLLGGGKRFRPALALLIGEMYEVPFEKIIPFAAAVELVHTYSLIHDDLPCMDNDDIRRGLPTNHKVYGEGFALLSGDSLLTEAFSIVAESYKENSFLAIQLIQLLSKASGIRGMVGGQALDLRGPKDINPDDLKLLHELKTGALIQAAAVGAALISEADESEVENIKSFGLNLGLAFQIADDILDYQEKAQEGRSFVPLLGIEKTKRLLNEVSDNCLSNLRTIRSFEPLEYLIKFNQSREK